MILLKLFWHVCNLPSRCSYYIIFFYPSLSFVLAHAHFSIVTPFKLEAVFVPDRGGLGVLFKSSSLR